LNFKLDKRYIPLVEQIKDEYDGGLTGFLTESIKNYQYKYFKLNISEGANLIAIIENFLEKNQDYQDKKYLKEIDNLKAKIEKYVDDN
jgi:hypothetical protein